MKKKVPCNCSKSKETTKHIIKNYFIQVDFSINSSSKQLWKQHSNTTTSISSRRSKKEELWERHRILHRKLHTFGDTKFYTENFTLFASITYCGGFQVKMNKGKFSITNFFTILLQFYYVETREWQNHGSIWIHYFISATYELSCSKVVESLWH